MEKLAQCVLLAACTFLFINYVAAFSCYSCNSHFHPDCGFNSKLNESHVTECPENSTLCRVIHQWVDYEQNGTGPDERLIRECGQNQTRERPYYYRQGLGGRMEVFSCYKTLCNSADYQSFSIILITCITVANFVIFNNFK